MSLRGVLASDSKTIIRDSSTGFGWPFTLTSPTGEVYSLTGLNNDIHLSIDPDTGNIISGRIVTVTFVTEDVDQEVKAIFDGKPWVVDVNDINAVAGKFKVVDSYPDGIYGCTVLALEVYKAS